MSKCDLQIVFDRTGRTFRGGEEVGGTVHVRVNQDVQCDGLIVEHFWQTHGRGNTATGPKQKSVVFQGNWRAGESFSYPFRFQVPNGPPTYRGNYLNVDHYVAARADIPWAFDPKCQEEYVLLPSGRDYGLCPPSTDKQQGLKAGLLKLGIPAGVVMIVLGIIFFCPVGLVLIPLGCAVIFFALRKSLAENRLGKVRLKWGALTVSPGEGVPLEVLFTPRRSSTLNGISAKLTGIEQCVSGSGTNRHTHTHKIHEATIALAPAGDVTAQQPIRIEGSVPIPENGAFSFSASDNQLLWSVEVRVDIPLWPDWVEKRVVTVRPPEEAVPVDVLPVEPPAAEPVLVDESAFAFPTPLAAAEVPQEPTPAEAAVPEAPPAPAEPAGEEPSPAGEAVTDPALIEIAGRLESANKYSREREEIIGQNTDRPFRCVLEIAKIERTYSYNPDERFRKGRTVTGVLAGAGCKITVQLSDARNDELESLGAGGTLRADCVLVKWNGIYDRLEMREA